MSVCFDIPSARIRVTHRDIARRLGCDKSTISLALRDHPRISAATRRRVRAAAEEMGYRPDPTLALLARHRWAGGASGKGAVLACLVGGTDPGHDFRRKHLAALISRGHERGYRFAEFDLDAYPSPRAISRVLHHRGIRGVIVGTRSEMLEPSGDFAWDQFTAVGCDASPPSLPIHRVEVDRCEGLRIAWQQAERRGYSRVGVALSAIDGVSEHHLARAANAQALESEMAGRGSRLSVYVEGSPSAGGLAQWLARMRPDVVLGGSNEVLRRLRALGVRAPDDLGFVSLDADDDGDIAGVSLLHDEVARAALDLLIEQIHDNCQGLPRVRRRVVLDPIWRPGATLPHQKKTPCRLASAG